MIGRINSSAQIGRMNRVARQKAGEFSPTDIAGCKLWLDFADANTLFTDAGSTKVTTDGDLIYQVNDKSGNGYNGISATLARRPFYKTSFKNGLSGCYDGGTDYKYLELPDNLRSQLTTKVTFFMVCKYDYHGKVGFGTRYYNNNADFNYHYHSASAFMFRWKDSTAIYESGVSAANIFMSKCFVYNSDDEFVKLYHNGSQCGGTAIEEGWKLVDNGANKLRLFHLDGMAGLALCEVITYTTALSDTDRSKVETYLNNKWAIY